MSAFDWKSFVRGIAPTVGAAVAGPLGASVLGGLSQIILGRPDGSEADIATAVASGNLTPEQIVQIKQLEADLQKHESEIGFKYADLEFQETQAYLADVQSARAREIAVRDYMPQIIFFLLLGLYAGEVLLFYFGDMPQDEFVRALMTKAFATVEIGLTGAIAYFIGSSKGSKNSGDAVRRIAEQQATVTATTATAAALDPPVRKGQGS